MRAPSLRPAGTRPNPLRPAWDRLPGALHATAALGYANVLWLLACLPVISAPAATCALYRAVDAWVACREVPTATGFLRDAREAFGRSLLTGLIIAVLAAVLLADLHAIGQMNQLRRPMLVGWLAVTLTLLLLTALVIPALATSQLGPFATLKAGAYAAIRRPAAAALSVIVITGGVMLVLVAPITMLIVGSATMCALRPLWRWAAEASPDKEAT